MAQFAGNTTGAQRGTKRKRPSSSRATTTGKVKQEESQSQGEVIARKLHHGLHEVRKAAKKAAAFELRKLVKRLKQARTLNAKGTTKGDDPAEMERQLEVLKHADHEQCAHTALKTKLLKDKLLAQNEEVQSAVADKLSANLIAPQEAGSSAAKVYGRLLSSKTLADAVHAVVDTLREVLDPSLAKEKTKGKSESQSQEVESRSEEDEEDVEVRPAKGKRPRLVEDGGQSGSEDDDIDDAGWESGTVDGGDGAGWESGTVDGDDAQVAHFSDDESSSSEEESDEEASADTGDSDALPSDGPQVKTKPKPKPKPPATDSKGKAKASGAESTFLPSLSVGFTRGDSDASDFSDGEADAPRKNRRGQRARRAIWEKKYGRNANHVKKQQETAPATGHGPRLRAPPNHKGHGPNNRDAGWSTRPGVANPQGAAAARGGARPDNARPWNAGGGGGGSSKGGAGAREEKPLHPSWEAKRKLKERLNPGIVPAQGKKITF